MKTSQAIDAKAFTVGNNIAFNKGYYRPGTHEGRKLLAHEITHTIQQTGGRTKGAGGKARGVSREVVQREKKIGTINWRKQGGQGWHRAQFRPYDVYAHTKAEWQTILRSADSAVIGRKLLVFMALALGDTTPLLSPPMQVRGAKAARPAKEDAKNLAWALFNTPGIDIADKIGESGGSFSGYIHNTISRFIARYGGEAMARTIEASKGLSGAQSGLMEFTAQFSNMGSISTLLASAYGTAATGLNAFVNLLRRYDRQRTKAVLLIKSAEMTFMSILRTHRKVRDHNSAMAMLAFNAAALGAIVAVSAALPAIVVNAAFTKGVVAGTLQFFRLTVGKAVKDLNSDDPARAWREAWHERIGELADQGRIGSSEAGFLRNSFDPAL